MIQKDFDGKILILQIEPHKITKEVFLDFQNHMSSNRYSKIFLLDTSDFIKADDYYELDDHLQSKGHRKIAKAIMQFINEKEVLNDSTKD